MAGFKERNFNPFFNTKFQFFSDYISSQNRIPLVWFALVFFCVTKLLIVKHNRFMFRGISINKEYLQIKNSIYLNKTSKEISENHT